MDVGRSARRTTSKPFGGARIVEGVRGRVTLDSQLIVKFHYGRYEPMLQPVESGCLAVAGPDTVCVRTPGGLSRSRLGLESELTVSEGQRVPFLLSQFPSHQAPRHRGTHSLRST